MDWGRDYLLIGQFGFWGAWYVMNLVRSISCSNRDSRYSEFIRNYDVCWLSELRSTDLRHLLHPPSHRLVIDDFTSKMVEWRLTCCWYKQVIPDLSLSYSVWVFLSITDSSIQTHWFFVANIDVSSISNFVVLNYWF